MGLADGRLDGDGDVATDGMNVESTVGCADVSARLLGEKVGVSVEEKEGLFEASGDGANVMMLDGAADI